MRILLTTDTVGGVWDHTATLAHELSGGGHEVLVAMVGEPTAGSLAALPDGVQSVSRAYKLEWMPDSGADVDAAGRWLRALADAWEADVVHLNQMCYAAAGFAAPTVTAVHSDVLSWFREVKGHDAPPDDWAGYARRVRAGLHASDAVVAPSRYQALLTERHYGRRVDHVIHNGLPYSAEPPASGDARTVVLTAGRAWDEAKGVRVLDDALALLGADAPDAHLLGETAAPGRGEIALRHLQGHGRQARAEVDDWMRRAALYVAPSLYEPFGLAPLEAALSGCALVLSEIGSLRELWDGCAAFFPRGDAAALAETLRGLSGDPAERARLAGAARTRALRRYAAPWMCASYTALYGTLVDTRTGRRARSIVAA
ncbi:MAG: glycosyl transferase, group 1 family protein [Gemmatimonadetes bacterium]|nr:glycosyl transferase, group 1 family protein [Gemmatimonadota bacterium]